MALRTYSVVVHPEDWSGPVRDLARLVAPVAGASSGELIKLFERGPMTIEADLSEAAARRLADRLSGLNIPSQIVGDDGQTLDGIDLGVELDLGVEAMLDSIGITEIEVNDGLLVSRSTPAAPSVASSPGDLERAAQPIHQGQTLVGTGPAPEKVLQAIQESKAAAQAQALEEQIQAEPPTQELVSRPQSGAVPENSGGWSSLFPGISPDEADSPLKEVSEAEESRTIVDTELPEALRAHLENKTPASGAAGWKDLGFARTGDGIPSPIPEVKSAQPDPAPSRPSSSQDGSGIGAALLEDQGRRAPYQPQGYQTRDPHDPGVAAFLSLIAPGAGQIYNGDGDESFYYAVRFWSPSKWLESSRLARSKGEKIKTYWAPRPPPLIIPIVRFVLGFWFCIFGSLFILGFVGNLAYEALTRERIEGHSESEISSAFDQAKLEGQEARIAALDAVTQAREEKRSKFTMSDEERAERLFRLGYELCSDGQLMECETTMKRVNALSKGTHKGAFRLQTWASMKRTSRGQLELPMPDVGPVESLEEFERNQLEEQQP